MRNYVPIDENVIGDALDTMKSAKLKIDRLKKDKEELYEALENANTRQLSLRLKFEDVLKDGLDGLNIDAELELINHAYAQSKEILKKYRQIEGFIPMTAKGINFNYDPSLTLKIEYMKSKRTYMVIVATKELPDAATQKVSLCEIMNPKPDGRDWEYMYALNDFIGIDSIMDLSVMEVIKFQANRDDKGTQGILIRLS